MDMLFLVSQYIAMQYNSCYTSKKKGKSNSILPCGCGTGGSWGVCSAAMEEWRGEGFAV